MNFFEKMILWLQTEMTRPNPYGWFHFVWIGLVIVFILILFITRKKSGEKQLKIVLATYGIVAFVLELLKQISWSFNYDLSTGITTWDYQWYAFPFQLCTTPIFISLICLFLKNNKIRKSLLSYMAFVTILGSFMTIIIPDSCFTSDILVNIHTMWLHCGSFVVSVYLLINKEVELKKENLISSLIVFLIFIGIAEVMNLVIYNIGILNGEAFNMFYISPYFISSLPVFDIIQQNVPFIIYLIIYIIALSLGATIVYFISKIIQKIIK